MTPRLALRGVSKLYGDVTANDDVTLDVMPGEILALLGENGAGKSTLMKIAYGALQPDAGTIALDGVPTTIASPARARELGIAMVFQHFALFETLTVAENIALGTPRRAYANVHGRLRQLAERYGLAIDPARTVHDLSVGERQRVEILRALLAEPRLLILDEPTSVLTPQAIDALFGTLQKLAADGVSVVFISHKLDEIRRLASRCAVMRAGRLIAMVDPGAHSEASLARLMLGSDPPALAAHESPPGDVALKIAGLTVLGDEGRDWLRDITFDVRAGEIVGIAGMSGNGQAALMAALAGERATHAEAIRLFGEPIGHLGTAARRERWLRYVPEERLGHAAVPQLNLVENIALTAPLRPMWSQAPLHEAQCGAADVISRFGVKAPSAAARADQLSGGNLQRFILGRELVPAPRVLIVDQPTWGVDVGAATAIRNALLELRGRGCAIVMVSEEVDELYQLADRIIVIAKGRVSPPVEPRAIPVDELGRWMAGLWPKSAAAA